MRGASVPGADHFATDEGRRMENCASTSLYYTIDCHLFLLSGPIRTLVLLRLSRLSTPLSPFSTTTLYPRQPLHKRHSSRVDWQVKRQWHLEPCRTFPSLSPLHVVNLIGNGNISSNWIWFLQKSSTSSSASRKGEENGRNERVDDDLSTTIFFLLKKKKKRKNKRGGVLETFGSESVG